MNKVLITGKNGNISTAIADWLKNRHGILTEQVSLRGGSWENLNFSDVDTVVHVAGIVPKEGVEVRDFYEINYKLTEKFAEKAKKDDVRHFIYVSSMAIYGIEPQISPKKGTIQEDTPYAPTSDYGKSKLLAEESLKKLKDKNFNITIIRVPSVYGKGKTEYLDQYKHIANKFDKIPKAFTANYKSMINIDNLCELIYLIIKEKQYGIICPDDGQISAFDICRAIYPYKKTSKVLGLIFEILRFSNRVRDYFGAVCYGKTLTDVFNGEYRVTDFKDAINKSYEK